jgi:hypothetical protein
MADDSFVALVLILGRLLTVEDLLESRSISKNEVDRALDLISKERDGIEEKLSKLGATARGV